MTKEMFVTKMVETLEAVEGVKEVRVETITKNNGIALTGIIPIREGVNISPTIYAEPYFDDYKEGRDIEDIKVDILRNYDKYMIDTDVDISAFSDFERVRNIIIPRVINFEHNKEYLKDKPYRQIEDLAIIYHIFFSTEEHNAYVVITEAHMTAWGVTEEELFTESLNNMDEVLEPRLISIRDMIKEAMGEAFSDEIFPESDEHRMYVLTNKISSYGACNILNHKFLDSVREQIGDFYILPSSVHELIAIPVEDDVLPVDLFNLVGSVNTTHVKEEEVLSTNVYKYDGEFKVA